MKGAVDWPGGMSAQRQWLDALTVTRWTVAASGGVVTAWDRNVS
jgi:hypothetical protein